MGVTSPPPDTHQTQVQNVTLEPVRDNPKAVSGSFSAKTLFYNQITHTQKRSTNPVYQVSPIIGNI